MPLTHAEQRKIIERGESICHEGRIISRVEDLPDSVTLAGDDPEKLAQVDRDLDAEIEAARKRKEEIARKLKEAEAAKAKQAKDEAAPGDRKPESGNAK